MIGIVAAVLSHAVGYFAFKYERESLYKQGLAAQRDWRSVKYHCQAEGLFRRALACCFGMLSRDNMHASIESGLASSMRNFGPMHPGRVKEISSHYEKSVAVRTELFGEANESTLRAMDDLGWFLHSKDSTADEGERLLKRAHSIRKTAFGATSRYTIQSLCSLASLYRNSNNQKAEALYRQAFETSRRSFGDDDYETTQWTRCCLRNFLEYVGCDDEAVQLAEQEVRIYKRHRPYLDSVFAENEIGLLFEKKSRYVEAANQFRRAISLVPAVRTEEIEGSFESAFWNNLARVQAKQGNNVEAEQSYKTALLLRRKFYGVDSPITTNQIVEFAKFYEQIKQYEDSEFLFREVLRRRTVECSKGRGFGIPQYSLKYIADVYRELNEVQALRTGKIR